MDFPSIENPFFRDSLRPLRPTTRQLTDKRYKPTVEAIYLRRSEQPNLLTYTKLPPEGRAHMSFIHGKHGDQNRRSQKEVTIEEIPDEYTEFREYDRQFEELKNRIAAIRAKSEIYPVWAGDKPKLPNSIARKFSELAQQVFALKKCFVSPEEIMLDNTASIIQRFWRTQLARQRFRNAVRAIKEYRKRELAETYKALNSWLAQMEYADSKAQQFHYVGVAKVSKSAVKFWVKWAEREATVIKRYESKANDFCSKLTARRTKIALKQWKEVALGTRSRKAMQAWRKSMLPKMKMELEKAGTRVPGDYLSTVATYIEFKSQKSFMFNFFYAWHAQCHSKSSKEIVQTRSSNLLYKRKTTTKFFMAWLEGTRSIKRALGSKENWNKYIYLCRSHYSAFMAFIDSVVREWRKYAYCKLTLRRLVSRNSKKLLKSSFVGWNYTAQRYRTLKLNSIAMWKMYIQDPKIPLFRAWHVYAIERSTKRTVKNMLLESYNRWRNRNLCDTCFHKWQIRYVSERNFVASKKLEKRNWDLQSSKHNTSWLSSKYSMGKDKIKQIEDELGKVTSEFIETENEITKLEDTTTVWRIALHAMKMELSRSAISVQECSTPAPVKRRRLSDEYRRERISNDDRYTHGTTSLISQLKISDRVMSSWKRRNSDPDIDAAELVDLKPSLDESILSLLNQNKE